MSYKLHRKFENDMSCDDKGTINQATGWPATKPREMSTCLIEC